MYRTRALLAIIVISLFLIPTMSVSANPLPPPADSYGDANPYVEVEDYPWVADSWKNLSFQSEKIVFQVKGRYDVRVEAEYVFKNKGGEDINTTIALPFLVSVYKLEVHVDGVQTSHGLNNHTPISHAIEGTGERDMRVATFKVNVAPGGTTTALVKYKRGFFYEYDLTTVTYQLRYLTTTGAMWPDPIEDAKFVFEVPKDMVFQFSDADGTIEDKGDYQRVTMTFKDWVPKENIKVKWWNMYLEGIGCISAIILALVGIPLIFIWIWVRSRRKRAHLRAQQQFYHRPGAYPGQPYQYPPQYQKPPVRPPPRPPPPDPP